MAIFRCDECEKYIDLDYDVEHYERCPTINESKEV
jgi:hypothetical protein